MAGLRVRALVTSALVVLVAVALIAFTTTSSRASSLTLTPVGGGDAIDIGGLSFADASSAISALAPGTQLTTAFPGLAGEVTLDTFAVDPSLSAITLTGTTADGDPAMLLATWPAGDTPQIAFAVDGGVRPLSSLGLTGGPSAASFARTVFVHSWSGGALTVPAASLPAAAQTFFAGLTPGTGGALAVPAGLGFAGNIDVGSLLPAPVAAMLTTGNVLVTGSLGGDDFSALAGAITDTTSLDLTATLPSVAPAALPAWLTLGTPTLTITASGDAIAATFAADATASAGGTPLVFGVDATLDYIASTASFDATLAAPWVGPFGLSWLTLNDTTLHVAVDSGGAVSADLGASLTAGTHTADVAIAYDGGDATLTATLDTLTSSDLAALLHDIGGVATPTGLPDITLSGLSLEVDTATEAVSLTGDASVAGVSGSVLVSAANRDGGGRSFLLGVSVGSTTLGDLPLGLTGAAANVTLPAVDFAYASDAVALDASSLTGPEQAFFDGKFGLDSADAASQLTLASGLNFESDVPLANLPASLLTALGLDSGGTLHLAGSLTVTGGAVSGAALSATLPGTPTIAGAPAWLTGDPAHPFELKIDYDGSVGTLGVSGGVVLSPDGTDVPFDLSLTVATDGSVTVSGTSTQPWAHPFGQTWLGSIDDIGLTLAFNPGGESSATLSSTFVAGSTTFGLDVALTDGAGGVSAEFTGTADHVSSGDLVALVGASGADTTGLSLPDVTVNGVTVTASAGADGVALEASGTASLFGKTNVDLVLSLVSDGASGVRVVGGIHTASLSLADLVPSTAGTFAGDLTLNDLAVVLSAGGGDAVARADLTPALQAFFDPIYGTTDYTVDLGTGVSLLSDIAVPAQLQTLVSALKGVSVDRLILDGSVGIPWNGDTGGFSLTASVPRIDAAPGAPDWFRYASVAFEIKADTAGTIEASLAGELGVTITESSAVTGQPTKQTDLTFNVDATLSGGPAGVDFTLAGGLSADQPWEQPFGIQWLTINQLSIAVSFQASTSSAGLQLSGDVDLGTTPNQKQLAVTIGLALNVETGIPTNFTFAASSTSNWGLQDLVSLYSLIDPAGGQVLAGIPDLQLRPVDANTPLSVKFALQNSPDVSAGFALHGSLWVEMQQGQPLEQVGVIGIDVGSEGIFLDGDSSIPILLGPATLDDGTFHLDWAFNPSDFSFLVAGNLHTDFFDTRVQAQIPLDIDFNAALQSALAQIENVQQAWDDLKPLLASQPVDTLSSDSVDQLYAAAGMQTPEWLSQLMHAIDALPNISGVPTNPVQLVNAVLGGFDISIPAGAGYPDGGVAPGTCAPLQTGPNGYCFVTLPTAGVEQGFDTIHVCTLSIYESGDCWIVPPSLTTRSSYQTFCPTGFLEGGKCWIVPPSITSTVPHVTACSGLAILESGKCWTVPPSLTWDIGYSYPFGIKTCIGIDSGGHCWSLIPGPPVLASPSTPQQMCPVATIDQNGNCYTLIPGAPLLTYPSTPTTGCPFPLVASGGYCWAPSPPVKSGATPQAQQVCTIPGIVQDGKCWKFGETPSPGFPAGGFAPGCPIWAPFFLNAHCWTIPPTPDVQLLSFPGVCHPLHIACTLDGLIQDTIITPIVQDLQQSLTPYIAADANQAPVADAGGPYSVPEGGGITVHAGASADPEGQPLTYAWDLNNDGQFDDATTVDATFSAAGIDGPATRTVSVRVADPAGNTDIARVAVEVTNVAPTLTVTGPASVNEAADYTLSLSATDPGSEHLRWTVDWGDGHADGATGNTASLTHQFGARPATPTITVTASDEDGTYPSKTLAVHVIAQSPTITAAVTPKADEGDTVSLSGSITEPGGDDVLTFTVDWGDGQTGTFTTPAGAASYLATHRYLDDPAGSTSHYPIGVTAVNEENLSGSASTSVEIDNVAPSLELSGGAGDEGSGVSLLGLITDPGSLDTFTAHVDWGDGSSDTYDLGASDRGLRFDHTYADNGAYDAVVHVTDKDGGTAQGTATFDIANVAPTVTDLARTPDAINENGTIALTGTIVDPGADAGTLQVDWGDGHVESVDYAVDQRSFDLSHQYLDDPAGPEDLYPVTITATDDDGGTTDTATQIAVANVAPSDVALSLAQPAIDEAGTATLHGTWTDPGTLDASTVTVDWGDGSAPTTLSVDAGVRAFDATHVYVDDNPSGTPSDDYPVAVVVTDDDGGSGGADTAVTVRNVAPSGLALTNQPAIDEHGVLDLSGVFVDPGTADTFNVSVDWGDGSDPSVLPLAAGVRTFDATHQYLDDNPTGTASDPYRLTVTVTDDDTGAATATSDFTVRDVAPVVAAPATAQILSTQSEDVAATFTDVGTLDTHTAVVDWGDGTSESVPVDESGGAGRLGASHRYVWPGDYPVTVTVTDDDGLSGTATVALTVLGPQDLKRQAQDLLAPHAGASKHVSKAIDEIDRALASRLWTDAIHPDGHDGQQVFDQERHAADELASALDGKPDKDRLTGAAADDAARALQLLARADWTAASVALVDTEGLTPGVKEVDRELASAQSSFAEGEAHEAAGEVRDAIQAYRETWQHVQRALEHASKGH